MDRLKEDPTKGQYILFSIFLLLGFSSEIAQGHNLPQQCSIQGLGVLNGLYNTHSNVSFFLGIPYAEPPTGKLRFQQPEAITWNGTLNATTMPPSCMQYLSKSSTPSLIMSEDCLYLNIYSPGNMSEQNANLSVMVWINSEGYSYTPDMKTLASRGDIIVVNINYRLGIFGFLSSGDTTLPGNAGLHDQVMALEWVKANIYSFGGDPQKITIFGQSAGAVSIYVLLASPTITNGLFSRAIMQSGMVGPVTDPTDAFRVVANLTSCPHVHTHGHDHAHATRMQIECMKNKTTEELLAVEIGQKAPIFGPVIDKVFLNSGVLEQLATSKTDIPYLIGLNNHEFVLNANDSIKDLEDLKTRLSSFGGQSFDQLSVQLMLSKFLVKDLERTYMNTINSQILTFIQNVALLVSQTRNAYMYLFTHHPSFSTSKEFNGARNSDELPFIFGNIFKLPSVTSDEEILSTDMISIWSSFARDGVLLVGSLGCVIFGPHPCEGNSLLSVVSTMNGRISGLYDEATNITHYRSIPYAQPPIGELRFREPQRPLQWRGILNGTRIPPACMQRRHPMRDRRPEKVSEDCLYLNIYVPGIQYEGAYPNYPVLFWIHGGDFVYGYSSYIDFSLLSNIGQLIIVSVGYRLDIFGFLSSGNKNLPGNAGLLDQHLALEWVNQNIHSFGGDRSRITLYGESTGATCVYYHVASPSATGLFNRAIIGGGVFIEGVDTQSTFEKVLRDVKCDKNVFLTNNQTKADKSSPHVMDRFGSDIFTLGQVDILDPVRCLQNRSAKRLLELSVSLPRYTFVPVVDSRYVPLSLTKAFSPNHARRENPFSVSVLIGVNSDGVPLRQTWAHDSRDIFLSRLDALSETQVPSKETMFIYSSILTNETARSVANLTRLAIRAKYYSDRRPYSRTVRDAYNAKYVSFIQAVSEAMSYPHSLPVFLYYFTLKPSFVKTADYVAASQTDELPFVFGNVLKGEGFHSTSAEKQLSKNMIHIWSSFIADGVPQLPNGVKWPPFEKRNRTYVELNVNITANNVKQRLRESDRIFWNELLPALMNMTSKPQEHGMTGSMMMTTAGSQHHHPKTESIAWGMSEQAVQDLLLSLLIVLIFMTVICATLIVILCKVRTIKLAAARHNNALAVASATGNVNKAFMNEATKSKPESITAL